MFSIIPPYYLSVNLEVASYQEAPAILLSPGENWTYTATLRFSHAARIQTPRSREFEQQALIQQAIPSAPPFYFVACLFIGWKKFKKQKPKQKMLPCNLPGPKPLEKGVPLVKAFYWLARGD